MTLTLTDGYWGLRQEPHPPCIPLAGYLAEGKGVGNRWGGYTYPPCIPLAGYLAEGR